MSIRPYWAMVIVLGSSMAWAGDWPQWRGPNRDNKLSDFTEPKVWPKQVRTEWKTQVGDGVASPVLAMGKIFVFSREGNDEIIRALDAANGKEIWKNAYAADSVTGPANRYQGPRSSPAVAEGKVCTLGVGGVVSCLDANDGKLIWRKETKQKPRFYTSCSPVIVNGMCVVHVGTDGKGEINGYDLQTGEPRWTLGGDGPSYSSPVIATIGNVQQIIVLTDKNLEGVSVSDGKQLWKTALSGGRYNTGTPIVDGTTVYCMGQAFTLDKQGDTFQVKPLWKGQTPHNYNTPVIHGGLLFGLSASGRNSNFFCTDMKTGKTLWTDSTTRGECGAILDAGQLLLALTSQSELIAFKPSSTGYEEVAKFKVAETPTWCIPIVDGKNIYVKDRDSVIHCVIE